MENRKRLLSRPAQKTCHWLICCIILVLCLTGTSVAKSILWKAEQGDHTLYIMGSVHVLKASHYPLAPALEDAYSASDTIAFEVDISESESPATAQLFMNQGMYQNGQILQDNISAQTLKELQQYLATIQISANMFKRMKPPLCAMTISMMEMQRLGFEPKYGLDTYFSKKAQQDGKKMAALETIDFQIKLFFDQSPADQELFLKQTLAEMSLMQGIMSQMAAAWLTGDTETLHTLFFESFADFPEFYDRLLLQRNQNWISKIMALNRANETTLIIVGAAHLVGKGSVIDLLKQRGYSFRQL